MSKALMSILDSRCISSLDYAICFKTATAISMVISNTLYTSHPKKRVDTANTTTTYPTLDSAYVE